MLLQPIENLFSVGLAYLKTVFVLKTYNYVQSNRHTV